MNASHFARYAAAMLLVLFAGAIHAAPEKIYDLTMSPATGFGSVRTATIKNATPNGNSSINSLRLTMSSAPASWKIVNATAPNGTVSIAADGRSLTVTNMSPVKPGKSVAITLYLSGLECNQSATFDTTPYTGSSLSGDVFAPNVVLGTTEFTCDGTLACGEAFPPSIANGQRGDYNKDGSACAVVNYDYTDDIANSNTAMLKWDTAVDPNAAILLTVTWKPEYVGANGLPTRSTKLQWFDAFGVLSPKVQGRSCITSSLPAPYGTLNADVGIADTTIQVTVTAAVPAVPFPIMINAERMTVTAVSGSGFTVARAQGGTAAAGHFATPAPKYVMSTPLPLDASGKIMQMCIWDEGWVSVPAGAPDCPKTGESPPAQPTACVQFTTSIFDIGDGVMIRD